MSDDRNLPAELKPEGAGLRYLAAARHRLRQPRPAPPMAITQAGSLAEARAQLRDVDVAVVDLGLPDGYGGD